MAMEPLAATPAGVDEGDWAAACSAVRAYCEWHIAPSVTETVTVDGSGGGVQLLPTLHLTELTTITNDGATVADPEWSAAGMVRGGWTRKLRGVTATITHGYTECPAEVFAVAKSLALAAAAARATPGAHRLTSGPHGIEFTDEAQAGAGALSTLQYAILDRYKLPPRP